jgi:putative surface-exposed virulence protein
MLHPAPTHRPLATLIALALCTSLCLNTYAAEPDIDNADCDIDPDHASCEAQDRNSSSTTPWLLGGLALAGAAAAAAGGGGGGSHDNNGGGGGGVPPGSEGGQYGGNQFLAGPGDEVNWDRNVETRVVGSARNEGALRVNAGTLYVGNDGHLRNTGTLRIGQAATLVVENDGDLDNHGTLELHGHLQLRRNGSLENHGTLQAQGATIQLDGEADIENLGDMQLRDTVVRMSGESEFDNGERRRNATLGIQGGGFTLTGMAGFENHGTVNASGTLNQGSLVHAVTARVGNERDRIEAFDNHGLITLQGNARVLTLVADSHASAGINRAGAQIISHAQRQSAMHAEGAQATLINQGTLTVTGDGAVAMSGAHGATLINDGVINLGVAGGNNGQNMVAMQSDGSATLNNRRGGVINIHADNSHAFQIGAGGGRLINNGQVNVHGKGSGMHADQPTQDADRPAPDLGWQAPRGVSGYTVGTNADGSAGQMVLHEGGELVDVRVDSGFTRGTDDSQIRLEDVFVGAEGGEENISSATVVWQAQAERDEAGYVDVVMTRNDYRDIANADTHGVAAALEAGYANNALYHSLEVADAVEFNHALQQLSGSGLAAASMRLTANGDAFWSSLARAPQGNGIRMVAFGPGSATASGVQGIGTGVQVAMAMGGGRQLQLSTGLLGSDFSTDGGQTRSQSRFAGAGMAQALGAFTLQHTLGNEWHQTAGQRQLHWGSTRMSAHSQRALSRTRLGSTLSTELAAGGLRWQPRLAATAYHTREGAFHEYGADALGLSVGAGTRSGMQLELGTAFSGRLGRGWTVRGDASASRSVAYRADARSATLHGAGDHAFTVPGLAPSGVDYRVMLGADYRYLRADFGGAVMAEQLMGVPDVQAQMQVRMAF